MARKQLGTATTNSTDTATKGYVDGVTGVDAVDITSLTTILGSQLANDDLLLIIDVSENLAKIITKQELSSVMGGGASTNLDGGTPSSTYSVSTDGGTP